jgi:hypothetical protein
MSSTPEPNGITDALAKAMDLVRRGGGRCRAGAPFFLTG